MQTFYGDLSILPGLCEPVALTIGNFDGVHRGHQFLIENLIKKSQEMGVSSALLCFEPHPDFVLSGQPVPRLMTFTDREQRLKELGLDFLVIQEFTREFADLDPKGFLESYLDRFFKIRSLLMGYDFKFGRGGQGSLELMTEFFAQKGVDVSRLSPFEVKGERPSSSKIRELILNGEIQKASEFLGAPYNLVGVVETGKALGRTLGFPTANLGQIQTIIPGHGVYVARIMGFPEAGPAVVNIGQRPTLKSEGVTVEVHILNFQKDLYGQELRVEFLHKIRDEQKFANLDSLKTQIKNDILVTEKFFGQ